jgi:hypothetical protein
MVTRWHILVAALGAVAAVAIPGALALGCTSPNCTETATCDIGSNDATGGGDTTDGLHQDDANNPESQGEDDGGGDVDSTVGPETSADVEGGDGQTETDGEGGGEDADGGMDAEAGADVASDADAGADSGDSGDADANGPDAQDAALDAVDGCVKTGPEICTDNIDNDCNGLTDCADTVACPNYTCAPQVPSGWSGPVELFNGLPGSLPTCTAGYTGSGDYHGGTLSGSPDTCSCTCTASGQTCSAGGTFFAQSACESGSAMANVTPATDGSCTSVPSNSLGSGGSFRLGNGSAPSPAGGTCTPQVTTTPGSTPSFSAAERLCAPSILDSPGGCQAAQQCVPDPIPPFGTTMCIWHPGSVSCPAAPAPYSNAAGVYYTDFSDTRGCGPCTCSGPTGGSCAGTIGLWGTLASTCSGTAAVTYSLGSGCKPYSGLSNDPGYVQATYALTAGSCSVSGQPQADGNVTGTGSVTVCCL